LKKKCCLAMEAAHYSITRSFFALKAVSHTT